MRHWGGTPLTQCVWDTIAVTPECNRARGQYSTLAMLLGKLLSKHFPRRFRPSSGSNRRLRVSNKGSKGEGPKWKKRTSVDQHVCDEKAAITLVTKSSCAARPAASGIGAQRRRTRQLLPGQPPMYPAHFVCRRECAGCPTSLRKTDCGIMILWN